MWQSSCLASIALTLVSSVLAGSKEIWWNVTYVDDINPDGLYPRRVVGVNGTWPYALPRSFSPTHSDNLPMLDHHHST